MDKSTLSNLTAIGVAFLLVGVPLGSSPAQASGEKPGWAAGDFWEYSGLYAAAGTSGRLTIRIDVDGTETVVLTNTTCTCYVTRFTYTISGSGPSGPVNLTLSYDIWYNASDLAPLRVRGTQGGVTSTADFYPPRAMRWPLQVGASWSGVEGRNQLTFGTYEERDYEIFVVGSAAITVPVGTFEAFDIRGIELLPSTTMSSEARTYFSPAVGNWLRVSDSTTTLDLVAYRYGRGLPSDMSGLIWVILLLVTVAVAIALVAVVMTRRRPPTPGSFSPGIPGQATPPVQPGP